MFFLVTLRRTVYVSPANFGANLHEVVRDEVYKLEGSMLDGNTMLICVCEVLDTSPSELDFDSGYAPFIVSFRALTLTIGSGEVLNAIVSDIVPDRDDPERASINAVAGPVAVYIPSLRTGGKLCREAGLEELIDVRDTKLQKDDGTLVRRDSNVLVRVYNPDADNKNHGITCTGDMVLK